MMMKTLSTTLLLPLGLFALVGQSPLYGTDSNATATATASGESSGSGSSHSESSSRRVVVINGKTVVDESTHTINGKDTKPKGGEAQGEGKPWLGIRAEEASSALRAQLGLEDNEGVVVADVVEDGPAEKAGLMVNDILLKCEGKPVGSPRELEEALAGRTAGDVVVVEYLRRGQLGEAEVRLENRPAGNGNPQNLNAQEQVDDMMKRMREMMEKQGVGGGAVMKIEGAGADLDKLLPNGGGGSIKIEVSGDNIQDLDAILDNPNIPDDFKRMVRDMMKRMEQFRAAPPK